MCISDESQFSAVLISRPTTIYRFFVNGFQFINSKFT